MPKTWEQIKALLKDAADGDPEGASGSEQGSEPQKAVQALLCPKSMYASSEDAVDYVESLGLDPSDVEDAGEFWAFIQFEPEDCTPESAQREEMDDGCVAVVCTRSQGQGNSSRVADTTQGGNSGSGSDNSDQNQGKSQKGCAGACSCKGKGTPEGGGKTKMADQGTGENKPEKILPGKALIKAFKAVLDELGPMQENTDVQRGCRKTTKLWAKIGKKAYPDEDFGFKADDADESDPDGDDDSSEGGDQDQGQGGQGDKDGDKEGKSLSGKVLTTCQDLRSWLLELASDKNLSASQKAAAKHHATQLGGILSPAGKDSPSGQGENKSDNKGADAGEESEIDLSALEKVFSSISEGAKRLGEQMYALTGK